MGKTLLEVFSGTGSVFDSLLFSFRHSWGVSIQFIASSTFSNGEGATWWWVEFNQRVWKDSLGKQFAEFDILTFFPSDFRYKSTYWFHFCSRSFVFGASHFKSYSFDIFAMALKSLNERLCEDSEIFISGYATALNKCRDKKFKRMKKMIGAKGKHIQYCVVSESLVDLNSIYKEKWMLWWDFVLLVAFCH